MNTPHGGALVQPLLGTAERERVKTASPTWPSWNLTARQICDLELILNGGFSPLTGFLNRADYESVCQHMRLTGGLVWPIPVVLDIDEATARSLAPGALLALRDDEGVMLAAVEVNDIWEPDRLGEARAVYDTESAEHPGVDYLLHSTNPYYVGGRVLGFELPRHYDFPDLRPGPKPLREQFTNRGCTKAVAFQTRNPMHRAHHELTWRAAQESGGHLLIHPVVGATKPGDVDHYTRVRCYKALTSHYPPDTVTLALLPLAMRMGGPREAVWHAIIRKNYGCTHFIVGRDHAGPGKDSRGRSFYDPYAAQELLSEFQDELDIRMIPFREMLYVPSLDRYLAEDEISPGMETANISGTELRDRLAQGRELPQWFTFSEVAAELRRSYPARVNQGCTIFFTGLSGSGKSTIANILLVKLLEMGDRKVTMLDGDLVRKHLSSELGFSKDHRDLNISRIGFVAAEVTRHGGIAICAPIAPYDATRKAVRRMVEREGGFILVHMSTPIEVCEARDRKGLYAKARAGLVKEFTGVSDRYEAPDDAELVIDASSLTAEDAASQILLHLTSAGYFAQQSWIQQI